MPLPDAVQELVTFLIPFALLAILALGLNLQWGYTGLFNAGVAGFYAIGAYTAAFLLTGPAPPTPFYSGHIGGFSKHFVVGVVGAFVFAALGGFLIGILTLRLREDYLAIATLALAEIVRIFLRNGEGVTGGVIGVLRIPRPFDQWGLRGPESDAALAVLFVGGVLLVLLILEWMTRAPWGRTLRAIREDEEAAQVLGKDTFWLKLQAFTIGCGIIGLAGALLADLAAANKTLMRGAPEAGATKEERELLFAAQPAIRMPRGAREKAAKMNRIPRSRFAT